jgi:hypothetical protein
MVSIVSPYGRLMVLIIRVLLVVTVSLLIHMYARQQFKLFPLCCQEVAETQLSSIGKSNGMDSGH